MSYRFADSSQAVRKPVCTSVFETCRVLSQNFEKFVHLVGFIIRIYHDARSAERQKRSDAAQI